VLVTVALGKRSFLKLKLLKNYLMSTISQERLNGLTILCIEKKLLDEIDTPSSMTLHLEMLEIFKVICTNHLYEYNFDDLFVL
jgi:hypothetical protein